MRLSILFLVFISLLSIQQVYGGAYHFSLEYELEDYDDDWDSFTNEVIPMHDFEAKSLDQKLIYAACNPKDTQLVPALIAQGANPNFQWYPSTQTPIYLASFFGNLDNVIFLIKVGADPNLGEGALLGVLRGIFENQFAKNIQPAHDIVIFLLNHGADYTAIQVQELIQAIPELKSHLTLAVQQTGIAKKSLIKSI
jgi:hypothetical protein